MGSSIVTDIVEPCCVLPHRLHPGLYNNSLGDISMAQPCSGNDCNGAISNDMEEKKHSSSGVPGFPDFPDFWQGETTSDRKQRNGPGDKIRGQKWRTKKAARAKRQQMRIIRKAVNISGTRASGTGKQIKKKKRNERRARRIERVANLQDRRKRKKDMGEICRGLASIGCK
ncbi:hypothetical protein ACHAWF_000863 [Thalassiosira exigua]